MTRSAVVTEVASPPGHPHPGAGQDERRRDVRASVAADPGDLAGAQPPERGRAARAPGAARARRPSCGNLGARRRSRLPQYGHSVMYGLTCDPHCLQTTNRSAPEDIANPF